VPVSDNFYATLNSAVFSDGSFVYVPPGVSCPMELSTYFRINAENTGQFERTLIIADKGAYVSYLEGCTAPQRDESQLHAAVVEIVVEEDAEVKYSTVQNWFPGNEDGSGGIYNFVTKRADCRGDRAKVMWTQVETGSAVTWKYPSCILRGEESQGEFYSIAITNNHQQADTGTKMVHLGKNTRSRIVSKGISAGVAQNTYRGLVSMHPKAKNSRNYTQCDSLLIGDKCGAHTVPYIEVKNNSSRVEHEATTSKVDDDQMFYCRQRGMDEEEAVALVVNGFCHIGEDEDPASINIPKVITTETGRMVYMSRNLLPGFKDAKEAPSRYMKQVCIYGFTGDELDAYAGFGRKSALEKAEDIEILRFLELDRQILMYECHPGSLAVDVPEDVAKVEAALAARRTV
jgi:Fe-S cluster assembly protein SufB